MKLSNQFLQWTSKFLAGYKMKQNIYCGISVVIKTPQNLKLLFSNNFE